MWTRAATQTQSERLVKQYNATHKNQVKLTVIPTDKYPAKLASAAGGKSLPDVFASDVVFAPNYTSQGLCLDITDRIDALPVRRQGRAGAHAPGTLEGKKYAVPHTIDMSRAALQQGALREGRARPGEAADHAGGVRRAGPDDRDKLGGDINGTYFGGNCGGCFVFTFWPSVWAAGGDVMNEDGTASTIDDPKHDRRRSRSTASCSTTASSSPAPRTRPARPGSASSPRARSA